MKKKISLLLVIISMIVVPATTTNATNNNLENEIQLVILESDLNSDIPFIEISNVELENLLNQENSFRQMARCATCTSVSSTKLVSQTRYNNKYLGVHPDFINEPTRNASAYWFSNSAKRNISASFSIGANSSGTISVGISISAKSSGTTGWIISANSAIRTRPHVYVDVTVSVYLITETYNSNGAFYRQYYVASSKVNSERIVAQ
jgi:hypothetical protein